MLFGVYARREAFHGNIDHARRVFDMALSSIEGLPLVRFTCLLQICFVVYFGQPIFVCSGNAQIILLVCFKLMLCH